MQIKIKEITEGCMPKKINQGDWIDLYLAEDVELKKGEIAYIPLGVAMELPQGHEAIIANRSSTLKKYGLIAGSGIGIVDNSYKGDNDEWRWMVIASRDVSIKKGTRICQFRVIKNQPEIEFVKVDNLGNEDRGGYGSTGD